MCFFFFLKLNSTLVSFQVGPPFQQPNLEQAATGHKNVPDLYNPSKKFQHVCVLRVHLCISELIINLFTEIISALRSVSASGGFGHL